MVFGTTGQMITLRVFSGADRNVFHLCCWARDEVTNIGSVPALAPMKKKEKVYFTPSTTGVDYLTPQL
jgi:hypothetical protein